jgi:hypothetical protein
MYKASIDIGRINKMMKIKFELIIKSESEEKYPHLKLISKFNYCGNDYFRINPNPFIVIDITSYMNKKDGYNTNNNVTLNRYYLFRFTQGLKKLIMDFKSNKDLFYYRDRELIVNSYIAENLKIVIPVSGSKTIMIQPCVVPDEESTTGKVYEGCIFYINSMENFAYLTYTEMEYLLYELVNIDMNVLSMQLISIVKEYENQEVEKIESPTSSEAPINSEVELSSPSKVTIIKQGEMPKI